MPRPGIFDQQNCVEANNDRKMMKRSCILNFVKRVFKCVNTEVDSTNL